MKLTTLDADLKIHQKLEDEPNDVGGLSAQALKEKFDQAGVTIQKFLNEVHLPEEEKAAEDTLQEARAYTDQKVAEMGACDMTSEVYDTQKRRTDIFAYADAAANRVKADTSNVGYVFGATCTEVFQNRKAANLALKDVVDPKELWDAETFQLTAPARAKVMVAHIQMLWTRTPNAWCKITVRVNGEDRLTRTGPFMSDAKYYSETLLMPVAVNGGDKVSFFFNGGADDTGIGEIRMSGLYVEFIL